MEGVFWPFCSSNTGEEQLLEDFATRVVELKKMFERKGKVLQERQNFGFKILFLQLIQGGNDQSGEVVIAIDDNQEEKKRNELRFLCILHYRKV